MFHSPPPFKNRRDAGKKLAAALSYLKSTMPVILALPRGGVPVAFEVALALEATLDVLLVRKIGAPMSPELGLGAVVEGDPPQRVLNQKIIDMVQAPAEHLMLEERRQLDVIAQRRHDYCKGRKRAAVTGRTVIVVDDGVATGGTMSAALRGLRQDIPSKLIFAVPVAPSEVITALRQEADEGICLVMPDDFRAVSIYYEDFNQTSDEEVIALLNTPLESPGNS